MPLRGSSMRLSLVALLHSQHTCTYDLLPSHFNLKACLCMWYAELCQPLLALMHECLRHAGLVRTAHMLDAEANMKSRDAAPSKAELYQHFHLDSEPEDTSVLETLVSQHLARAQHGRNERLLVNNPVFSVDKPKDGAARHGQADCGTPTSPGIAAFQGSELNFTQPAQAGSLQQLAGTTHRQVSQQAASAAAGHEDDPADSLTQSNEQHEV